jgi:hypothetical protein
MTTSPASGTAAATPFTLSAAGWLADSDDAPLEFQFAYAGPSSSDDSVAQMVVIRNFDTSPSATFHVPWERRNGSEPVTFLLSVRNRYGLVSTATAQVTVEWSLLDSEIARGDLVRSVTAAASSAFLSGQPVLVMSAVEGLASLLNSFSSDPGLGGGGGLGNSTPQPDPSSASSVTAQAERSRQRADILGVLAAATTLSPPNSRVQAISAIAKIVSVSNELSTASQNAALSLLGSVMSSGAAIPATAAESVVRSLSKITGSLLTDIANGQLRSPPPGEQRPPSPLLPARGQAVNPPVPLPSRQALLQVMSVLSAVRNTQVQQAVAATAATAGSGGPGFGSAVALVSIQTEHIRMTVFADSVGADSRIFKEPLSAPGSTASFEPLPPGVAAALAAFRGSTVVTEFLSLSFKCASPPSIPPLCALALASSAFRRSHRSASPNVPAAPTCPLETLAEAPWEGLPACASRTRNLTMKSQ